MLGCLLPITYAYPSEVKNDKVEIPKEALRFYEKYSYDHIILNFEVIKITPDENVRNYAKENLATALCSMWVLIDSGTLGEIRLRKWALLKAFGPQGLVGDDLTKDPLSRLGTEPSNKTCSGLEFDQENRKYKLYLSKLHVGMKELEADDALKPMGPDAETLKKK